MKQIRLLLLCISMLLIACSQPTLTGLWTIEKVEIGDEEMTPDGRWISFNEDQTQQSGNGWTQHSEGTWEWDTESGLLSIENTNGLADEAPPFKVIISGAEMTWSRLEDEAEVTVHLKQAEERPKAIFDELYGLWKLEGIMFGLDDTALAIISEVNESLYFGWDNRFRVRRGSEVIGSGVYAAHGHRKEIDFFYMGKEARHERLQYDIRDGYLQVITPMDTPIVSGYSRINR